MAINEENSTTTPRRKPWVPIGVLLGIVLFIGLLVKLTPKGFDMNLTQIGAGKPALVFVYDPNLAVSIKQSEEMNIARDQLGSQALFLIAKVGTPEGSQVTSQYDAKPSELLLFNASGQLVQRQFALKTSDVLIPWIKSAETP